MEAKKRPDHSYLCNDFLEENLCPCVLAELKRCPVCSHLLGNDLCNCEWVGTCIYSNYRFSEAAPLPTAPTGKQVKILKAFHFKPAGMMIYAQVAPQMLCSLSQWGMVQLKYLNSPAILRVPAVVCEVFEEHNIVELAILNPDLEEQHLLKTLPEVKLEILREPTIYGFIPLLTLKDSKALVIASGSEAILAPSLTQMLQLAGNEVTTAIGTTHPVIQERITALNSKLVTFNPDHIPFKELLNREYSYICCSTTEFLNKKLFNSLRELRIHVPIAYLNPNLHA